MASSSKEEKAKTEDKTTPAGPTSTPAGTDKPKRTRVARKPSAPGLTADDHKLFETYLTTDIETNKATATDDQLETWFAARKRVRGVIAAGGAS